VQGERAELELRVLGGFEVIVDGHRVDIGGPKLRRVMARLVVSAGRTVGVASLVEELWGGHPPADAYRTVRTYVSRLRAVLCRAVGATADEMLHTRPPGYQLRIDPDAVDAVRFERLATAGRQALQAGRAGLAVEQLTSALGMWQGNAFAEFDQSPVISVESTRLNRLRLAVIEARVDAALALGLDAHLVGELEALVRTHPTRERLWEQLMTALYRSGCQADALAAFRTARDVLVGEYGVEPSPRLVEIHRQVLHHDARLAAAPLRTAAA
jgi:DNA-binding SARP family transcriptional activator